MQSRFSLFALVASLAVIPAVPVVAAAGDSARKLNFDVFLDDRAIGYQRFVLATTGEGMRIETRAEFAVKLLRITAFEYDHRNTELWRDGCLQAIDARTDSNGKQYAVSGRARGDSFVVGTNGGERRLGGCVASFAYLGQQAVDGSAGNCSIRRRRVRAGSDRLARTRPYAHRRARGAGGALLPSRARSSTSPSPTTPAAASGGARQAGSKVAGRCATAEIRPTWSGRPSRNWPAPALKRSPPDERDTRAGSRTDWLQAGVILMILVGLVGCAGAPAREPIHTVEYVDLERFMGDWYVIANIPTFIETGRRTMRSRPIGSTTTAQSRPTFTFRKYGFDGEQKTYTPRGFVRDDGSNAVWGCGSSGRSRPTTGSSGSTRTTRRP